MTLNVHDVTTLICRPFLNISVFPLMKTRTLIIAFRAGHATVCSKIVSSSTQIPLGIMNL